MNYKLIFSTLILMACILILNSCNSKASKANEKILAIKNEDVIFAVWKRVKVEPIYKNELQKEDDEKYPIKYIDNYFMSIFPDGKGSFSFMTELDSITWEYKNDHEIFIPTRKHVLGGGYTVNLIESLNDTLIKVTHSYGYREMTFTKLYNLTSNYKEDPNYTDNNLWRLRANININDSLIEVKVNNYLKYYELLFKAALDEDNKRPFTNKYSKGILKIYQSAIGIVKKHEIGEDWYSYFNTKEEAHKAYDMLKEKLKNKTKIKRSKDWIKDNYEILRKLNEGIEEALDDRRF